MFVDAQLQGAGDLVRQQTAARSIRAFITYVGGNTKVYGAALFRLRERGFRRDPAHGGISPAWPVGYDEFEPYYAQAEAALPRARPARRGPDRAARRASPMRIRRSATSRASRSCTTHLQREGLHPFPPAARHPARRERERQAAHASACIRCDAFDGFPCLVNGKADAQVICVDPALRTSELDAADERLCRRLETEPVGPQRRRVHVDRDGDAGRVQRPTSSWSPAARSTPRCCCCARPTSASERTGERLRSVGRNYMRHNNVGLHGDLAQPNPTRIPEDAGAERLLFRRRTTGNIPSAISRCGQVRTATRSRRRRRWLPWAAGNAVRRDGAPLHRFLAYSRGPARSGEPGELPRDGRVLLDLAESNMEGHAAPAGKAREHAATRSICITHFLPRSLYLGKNIPIGGTAHQAGTMRFGRGPGQLGARSRLQGARARQSVRR